jgi:hypothetical protein
LMDVVIEKEDSGHWYCLCCCSLFFIFSLACFGFLGITFLIRTFQQPLSKPSSTNRPIFCSMNASSSSSASCRLQLFKSWTLLRPWHVRKLPRLDSGTKTNGYPANEFTGERIKV